MAVTLKDIANKVGVHPSTISRVLSGDYENFNVSPEIRDSIYKAVKELNYVPNEMARSLRLKKTQMVGLVVPNILNPVFAELAHSIDLACDAQGYGFVICNTFENQEKETKYINMLKSRGIDGLVIVPVQEKRAFFDDLIKQDYPFVLALRQFDDIQADAVVTDHFQDVFKAVEYLIKLGHRHIAFIDASQSGFVNKAGEKGYKQALSRYNMRFDHDLIQSTGATSDSGYEAARQIFNLPHRPTALMVTSDSLLVGVLKAAFESGLAIPEDLSLVGCSNSTLSPYMPFSLTAISQPVTEIGEKAAELLFRRIESKTDASVKKIVLHSQFNVGDSTLKAFGS